MLGFKLIHVSKSDPMQFKSNREIVVVWCQCEAVTNSITWRDICAFLIVQNIDGSDDRASKYNKASFSSYLFCEWSTIRKLGPPCQTDDISGRDGILFPMLYVSYCIILQSDYYCSLITYMHNIIYIPYMNMCVIDTIVYINTSHLTRSR